MKAFALFVILNLVTLELASGARCDHQCEKTIDHQCGHTKDCYVPADNFCDLKWKACLRRRRHTDPIVDITQGQCPLDKPTCEENIETYFHTQISFK